MNPTAGYSRMSLIRTGVWSLALLAASVQLQAADPVRVGVGSPLIHGTIVTPFTGEFAVVAGAPDGRTVDAGSWIDRVELTTLDGRIVLKREQICNAPPPRTSLLFTVYLDPQTLRPLVTQMLMADGTWYRRDFTSSGMHLRELSPATQFDMRQQTLVFDRPAFDFYGGAFGLLLAALPMDVGRSYALPVYTERDAAPLTDDLVVTVAREERLRAGYLGELNTHVLEFDAKNGHYTAWVIPEPPYVVRLLLKGKRGGTLLLKVPDTRS